MSMNTTRKCAVCGVILHPFYPDTFTAHEFKCYMECPELVPAHQKHAFEREMVGEKRRRSGRKGAETRLRNRRAQRRLKLRTRAVLDMVLA